MTLLLPDVRLGAQRPRVHSGPSFSTSAGAEAIDLAASAGLVLDDWQAWVLEQSLGEQPNGKWAAFEVGLTVPRQNGKGSILEARELAGLFLFDEMRIIHSAHELKTSKEHFYRMQTLINGSGLVDPELVKYRASNEEWSITVPTGAKLHFLARSTGGGRGFTGDVVILDEAYALSDDATAALLPIMAAKSITGNPQIWYTSSAGLPNSTALARIRERGSESDPKLFFADWSADPECDPSSVEAALQANPAAGKRISLEFIESMQRTLEPSRFAREFLGIWSSKGEPPVLTIEQYEAHEDKTSTVEGDFVVAVSTSFDRSSTSISVCGENADGIPHVELIECENGVTWAGPRLIEIVRKGSPVGVLLDASEPAGSLLPVLQEAGIDPWLISARDVATGWGLFVNAVENGPLAHPVAADQIPLVTAIEAATKRKIGDAGGHGWARRDPAVDITPLVAATHALFGWMSRSTRAPKKKQRSGKVW